MKNKILPVALLILIATGSFIYLSPSLNDKKGSESSIAELTESINDNTSSIQNYSSNETTSIVVTDAQSDLTDEIRHLGEFLDPDSVDLSSDNTEIRHLGEFIDPDSELTDLSSGEIRHLGEYMDPDNPSNAGSDVIIHLGEYMDPDELILLSSQRKAKHIGEMLDPDNPDN